MVRRLCVAVLFTTFICQPADAQTRKRGVLTWLGQQVTQARMNKQRTSGLLRKRQPQRRVASTSNVRRTQPSRKPSQVPTRTVSQASTAPRQVAAPQPAQPAMPQSRPVAGPQYFSAPAGQMSAAMPIPPGYQQPMPSPQMAVTMRRPAPVPVMPARAQQTQQPNGAVSMGMYPQTAAALYPCPLPNIPYQVGGSAITNQAFHPHEMLYPHEYHAIYPPYYYKVNGGWIVTPFGVWSHENWKPMGTEVKVKYRSYISPLTGFKPPRIK